MSQPGDPRTYEAPIRPYTRSNAISHGDTEWNRMQYRVDAIPHGVPGNFQSGEWQSADSADSNSSRPMANNNRTDEFYRKYQELVKNVAHRYPDPGPPRERQGCIGGRWRHIKEVLGQGGSRVVFVDGLVKQYDTARSQDTEVDNMISGPNAMRRSTPTYAPNRHDVDSYGEAVYNDFERKSFKPSQSTAYYAPRPTRISAFEHPQQSARGTPTKYKGFYTLRREQTFN